MHHPRMSKQLQWVTDINDITPVYQAADADDAITVNENVGTGSIDAGTITDADTVGTYVVL